MTEKKTEILQALRDTLQFHRAMGIDAYPFSEDVRRFLERKDRPGTARPAEQRHTAAPHPAGIENLEQEINGCARCLLSRDPLGRVPGKGKTGCRLFVVGDWSSQSGTFSADILFGREEDEMLWKMMAAIDLQPDRVYVTNCLKCCPPDPEVIDRTCEESCFSFLAREIAAVRPHIICAMGEMAARVLMGRKEPLARVRGRFGGYRYQSGETVLVMPTFHPRFLLQHQELKKATWKDLLAIKARLEEL